jgi:hypothetical protein
MHLNHKCRAASQPQVRRSMMPRAKSLVIMRYKPDESSHNHAHNSFLLPPNLALFSDDDEAKMVDEAMSTLSTEQSEREIERVRMGLSLSLIGWLTTRLGSELAAQRFSDELVAIGQDMDRPDRLPPNFDGLRSEDEALLRLTERRREEAEWAKIQEQEEEGKWERRWIERDDPEAGLSLQQSKTIRVLRDAFLTVNTRNHLLHEELKRMNDQGIVEKRRSEGGGRAQRTAQMDLSSIHNELMDVQSLLSTICDEVIHCSSKLVGKAEMMHDEFDFERTGEGRGRHAAADTEEHWA